MEELNNAEIKAFSEAMDENKDELYLLKLTYLAVQIREKKLEHIFKEVYNAV